MISVDKMLCSGSPHGGSLVAAESAFCAYPLWSWLSEVV